MLVECASAIKDRKGIMGTSNKKVFTFSYQTGSGEANAALEAVRPLPLQVDYDTGTGYC